MKSYNILIKEQIKNIDLIKALTFYSIKSEYANHKLGIFWSFLLPVVQVITYYIIFGMGLRGDRGTVDGVPYLLFLVSGLFPWLFISGAISGGSNAILSKISIVTKMKFPSSILLTANLFNNFSVLIISTFILFICSLIGGYTSIYHYFTFIYFLICSFAIIFSITLTTSIMVVIIRDFKQIVQNVLRLGFFLTPIFWSTHGTNHVLKIIITYNPFAYLLEIYRTAFIYKDFNFYSNVSNHFFFWITTLFLFTIGVFIHNKYKYDIADYM